MMNERGFTLIELLLVLSIMSILISIVVPLQFTSLTHQTEKHFIEQLHSDVLFLQNQAHINSKESIRIRFFTNHYSISWGRGREIKSREYPENWSSRNQHKDTLEFSSTGTVKRPRRIPFYTNEGIVFLVFSFGKGRFHVDETERFHTN